MGAAAQFDCASVYGESSPTCAWEKAPGRQRWGARLGDGVERLAKRELAFSEMMFSAAWKAGYAA